MRLIIGLFLSLFLTFSTPASVGDFVASVGKTIFPDSQESALALGFNHGGGGFMGIDYERQIQDRFAWTAGVGIVSMGFQLRYHLDETLISSFWSAGLWHQGFDRDRQRILGVTYGYRHKTLPYTVQIGLGAVMDRGGNAEDTLQDILETDALSDLVFIYSLGYHFSL